MGIPALLPNGYLPEGVFETTIDEVRFRFGSTPKRRRLFARLSRWIFLAQCVKATRLLIDGSFVTAKAEPGDIDAVVQLTSTFDLMVNAQSEEALELLEMLTTRQPEELFGAEDDDDWNGWVEFFQRTREANGVRKGLLEIRL